MSYELLWGDLHSHCAISYGEGTVRQALRRAAEQLDFCSITGHAFWPDMPVDRARYGEVIDYHREGFARLAGNWEPLISELRGGSVDGRLIVFPSYEWHSLEYGDHNVYGRGPELPLRDAPDLPKLAAAAPPPDAMLVPHHIGYAAGYRGLNWAHFDARRSPLVEVFSLHGCSESEEAPYPMLHDMGPRDAGSMARAGWLAGHRFGIIASTDHHGGYPGSHGDGRAAVLATAATREAVWDAFWARRVYAVTGDKIEAGFTVNGAPIGAEIDAPQARRVQIQVRGWDALERVELLKNERIVARFFPAPGRDGNRYRLRITWGWGRKDEPVAWEARLSLTEGVIRRADTCFSGQSIVAPRGVGGHAIGADADDLPHRILEQGDQQLRWRSVTVGNLSTRHPTTQALSLELDAPPTAHIVLDVNGVTLRHSLDALRAGGHSHYLRGWLSEAIRVGPLVPLDACTLDAEWSDGPQQAVDWYRLRVAQTNGQWAWLTPVWAAQ